ncbi:MAG: hypothetical protein AMXMBFR34_34190 [Myxococcaceae bacterium]
MSTRVRLNARGESYAMLRVVLGGGPALFGAYGLYQTLWRWKELDFLKTDDLISTAAVFVVGSAVCLGGLWRRKGLSRNYGIGRGHSL